LVFRLSIILPPLIIIEKIQQVFAEITRAVGSNVERGMRKTMREHRDVVATLMISENTCCKNIEPKYRKLPPGKILGGGRFKKGCYIFDPPPVPSYDRYSIPGTKS